MATLAVFDSSMSEGGATAAALATSLGSAFLSTQAFLSSSQTMDCWVSSGRCIWLGGLINRPRRRPKTPGLFSWSFFTEDSLDLVLVLGSSLFCSAGFCPWGGATTGGVGMDAFLWTFAK